jgi:hypothetical protein
MIQGETPLGAAKRRTNPWLIPSSLFLGADGKVSAAARHSVHPPQ